MLTCDNQNCPAGTWKDGFCTDENVLACYNRIRPVPQDAREEEEETVYEQEDLVAAYKQGKKDGIRLFAWWKDGRI